MCTSHTSRPSRSHAFGIDVHHDALAAKTPRRLPHELGVSAGRRIDRHLVAAGVQQRTNILDRPDPAPHGQRHEDLLRRPADHVDHDVPPLVAGRDVQKHQFVGTLLLVTRSHLDRIPRVAKIDEIRPFHDAAAIDIQTGNHTVGQHLIVERFGDRRQMSYRNGKPENFAQRPFARPTNHHPTARANLYCKQ